MLQWSDRSSQAYERVRLGTENTSKKRCFYHFFHKLATRVTPMNVTEDKLEPMRWSTNCSTRFSQSAVPVRYESPSVLQFWILSTLFQLSDVEMSKIFSRLWLAQGIPTFRH